MIKLLIYLFKWLIMQAIRFVRVVFRYLSFDVFKLFNVISISISLTLVGTWISIIIDPNIRILANGSILQDNNHYTQIDRLSNLATLYDTYVVMSSINTIIIFWRIIQFFSFSFKLSAFSEILSSAKNDVFFFILMFVIIVFGYAVMAYSYFGQSDKHYADLFFTIIMLFELLIEYFNFDDMLVWNPGFATFFFVSFMLLCDMFMKNMFIAIIMAHYDEFHEQGGVGDEMQEEANEEKRNR